MKIIAYYLPQFHEVEENNIWWGKGFTEWTNVKNAKPIFNGHLQPRIPLNKNYYNLLDRETVEWQTNLMHKYNIYGFCYYHYWFSGKKLLEKPAEQLLRYKDINQRFCFCWANADWRKTWVKENTILIKQTYGEELEWKQHLDYLLPFFKDDRYIKVDNKPILVILNQYDIPNAEKRFHYYDEYLKNNGFKGIEFIESMNVRKQKPYDFVNSITFREPSITHYSMNNKVINLFNRYRRDKRFNFFKKPIFYKIKKIYKESIKFDLNCNFNTKKIYLGAFKEWDSTSRHGVHGFIISKASLSEFRNYLENIKKIINNNRKFSDIVFFTAWNEWCECCYLEPDNKDEYGYLEIIQDVCNDSD